MQTKSNIYPRVMAKRNERSLSTTDMIRACETACGDHRYDANVTTRALFPTDQKVDSP